MWLGRDEDRAGKVFMQVGSADAAPGDLDLDLARFRCARLGNVLDADVFFCVPFCSFHACFSFLYLVARWIGLRLYNRIPLTR